MAAGEAAVAAADAQRLSVVIPALDEAAAISATLAALQPMRSRGHEVILVDGGSRDDTRAVAEPMVDRVLVTDPGRATQLAAGVAAARHPRLWLLHADTLAPPDADQLIVAALRRCCWGRFDVRLSGRHPLLRLVGHLMNGRSRLTGICTGDQGMFMTRDALTTAGGIPPLALMEDVALSRRLKTVGRPACIRTPLVTSSRRWEQRGVLRTILLMWSLRAAYALGVDPKRLARLYA